MKHRLVVRLATGWTVKGSNTSAGEIFRNCPDQPWGPPSLLCNGHRVSFPMLQQPGRGVDHPPPSSTKVKERVELNLYSSTEPSWPVLGRALPLPLQALQSRNLNKNYYHVGTVWHVWKESEVIPKVSVFNGNFCNNFSVKLK